MIFTLIYRGKPYLINAEHLARLILLLALRKTHQSVTTTNNEKRKVKTEKTVCEINYDSLEWQELDKLARQAGYQSAMICANECGQWRAPISEFRAFLEASIHEAEGRPQ